MTAKPSRVPARRILLAEDDESMRAFIERALLKAGYEVTSFANGREAFDIAARHPGRIHLLITDLIMPEMGGVDLAARMRSLNPAPAVLFMSGYNDRPLAAESRDDLIEKPFTPTALLDRVERALARHAGNPAGMPPPSP